MAKFDYKFHMYRNLQANIANIMADARKAADEIGIPKEVRGKFGLTGAISGCPAPLRADIMEASEKGAVEVIPLAKLAEQIREIVKSVYGDDYDAVAVNTCEAGLWLAFDCLFAPPNMGRGDNYRARYIAPYERHLHHQGAYGRPFPARFKDILADRGCTPGEYGFYGKRLNNLDTVIVPLTGAKYEAHGIKYHPSPLLSEVDPEASIQRMRKHVDIHASYLTGFTSLAYDTPGYGYGAKDADGTPLLQKYMADLAHEYDLPYVLDDAMGLPFVGHDITKSGADVIIYSMDKATGSATSGLVIGKEEYLEPLRRAMGMHGDRYGTVGSYGKAAYVTFDPGKEALLTQVQALKVLRDNPEILTKPVDDLEKIVKEEFAKANPFIRDGVTITKSYNNKAIEINYEKSWKNGMGIPVFSIEDMYAGTALTQTVPGAMGIIPTIGYDGNFMVGPDLGTTDSKGELIEDLARYCVKGLVKSLEIICKYAGVIE